MSKRMAHLRIVPRWMLAERSAHGSRLLVLAAEVPHSMAVVDMFTVEVPLTRWLANVM